MTENTKRDFEINKITRRNILASIEGLTYEQVIKIPTGFNNSILWNFMHNLVTQQLLTYGLVGEKTRLNQGILNKFRKGSEGNNVITEEEFEFFKQNFVAIIDQTEQDYYKLMDKKFNVYTTSYNITLNTLEEVIQFINTHGGLHFGIIMSIKKFV